MLRVSVKYILDLCFFRGHANAQRNWLAREPALVWLGLAGGCLSITTPWLRIRGENERVIDFRVYIRLYVKVLGYVAGCMHLHGLAGRGEAHDAGHAAREALLGELRQQNGQQRSLVAAQHVVRHAATCT